MPQRRQQVLRRRESLHLSFVSNDILRATYLDQLTQETDKFKVFIFIFFIVFIHRRAWRRCNIASLLRMLQSLASSSCVRLMQNHKSTWYFASLLLGYVLYLVFGAIIFSSVELPYEDLLRQELRAVKQRFLQENQCLSEERLERFLKKALDASSYGVSILNNASVNWNWDFTSSLFFASTVLSTTGECGAGRGGCGSLPGAQRKSCNIFASASMCVLNE